jgi:predicted RNA binding protein YcfA (HicA-like mRNA interferase family)
MQKRPVVSWKDAAKLLRKLGYAFIRQNGSHMIFSIKAPAQGSGKVSLPKHKELDAGTRDEIIAMVSMHTGISEDDIVDMLR